MSDAAISALRRKGDTHFNEQDWERALAFYAELVRLSPGDHQARFRAARCLLRLGEQERAVTAYHAAAEGLVKKGYLLSAMAACKEALRINPVEKRVKETLRRIHAQAVAEVGRTPVPPPPAEDLYSNEGEGLWEALTALEGSELVDKAMEVLVAFDEGDDLVEHPPLPLFPELDPEAFIDVVIRMDLRDFQEGEVLIEQGRSGDGVYVICVGEAKVTRKDPEGKESTLATLPGGTLVGEMALLTDAPRSASVVASRPSEVFVMRKADLEEVAKKHPGVPQQLVGFCRRRLLSNLINTSPLFVPFDEEAKKDVLQRFQSKVYSAGEALITEGREPEGLFVVLTGETQVTKKDEDGATVVLASLREGDVAGEIGLIRDTPATATVKAVRKTAVVMLPGDDFFELISDHHEIREYLQSLTETRLKRTSAAMSDTAEEIGDDDLVVL